MPIVLRQLVVVEVDPAEAVGAQQHAEADDEHEARHAQAVAELGDREAAGQQRADDEQERRRHPSGDAARRAPTSTPPATKTPVSMAQPSARLAAGGLGIEQQPVGSPARARRSPRWSCSVEGQMRRSCLQDARRGCGPRPWGALPIPRARATRHHGAMTLLQRVFAGNALVVFVGALILALSPATSARRITARRGGAAGDRRARARWANVLLMRRALAPLRALAAEMAAVDPLRPAPPHGPRTGVGARSRSSAAPTTRCWSAWWPSAATARGRAIAAQEAERARIGRELHDEVGQALTGVTLELKSASELADGPLRERLTEARRRRATASRPCGTSRAACGPRRWRTSACAARWSRWPRRSPTAPRCASAGSWRRALPPLPPEHELVVYRIAQEALTNVARHADAREACSPSTVAGDAARACATTTTGAVAGRGGRDGLAGHARARAARRRDARRRRQATERGTAVRLRRPPAAP